MLLSKEESESSGDFPTEEPITSSSKRKRSQQETDVTLKKVRYEDITSKEKHPKNELYKPPTVEELNELKETQNLFNNNLFRLQIEELIKEVKIKNKHRSTFNTWFPSFEALIGQLPEFNFFLSEIVDTKERNNLSKQSEFINSITNLSLKCDQDLNIKLSKPEHMAVFGLDKINSLAGPNLRININLTMPRSYFNVKDYLNNRYFVKKHIYLTYIIYFLKKHNSELEITLEASNNNLLSFIQIIFSKKLIVKINATPLDNYFKPSRCLPDVNNVKVNVLNSNVIVTEGTVFYNNCLAHDITLRMNNSFIEKTLIEVKNIQEAIKLIDVWLRQRDLNTGFGAFTDDLVLYFIVYLFIKKKINKHMSSYQVIRNFWNFIIETDLTIDLISLSDETKPDDLVVFKKAFDVVFLDLSGCYNVASFLDVNIYRKIKFECGIAFKLLDDHGINSFHNLFITRLPVELQYDLFVNLDGKCFDKFTKNMDDHEKTKYLGFSDLYTIDYIGKLFKQGLNKRASLIVPIIRKGKLSFGINLDRIHAFTILEKGPALNDPQEVEFKKFWGKLSTDRRFKDGSVCVAVHFETNTIKGRREIIKTIINWIITEHLHLKYHLFYDEFEDFIINKKITASYPIGTNEECCLKAISASDELGKKLRSFELPLAVTGVQGISNTFCLTEVFPPISTNYRAGTKITTILDKNLIINDKRIGIIPRHVKPLECVLQLEHSSKWPKDITAIKHMKTAVLFELSKALSKKHQIVSSVKPEQLEVLYEGFVFRYEIYLPREIGCLKKETTSDGVTIFKDTLISREIQMKLEIRPKLISALKGLHSQHPCFGPSTALIKRWLRSHLIDDYHFSDDVLSLLNASLYLNQSAFNTPCTPQSGFLRFLKFISELQWHIQAVVVDFNEEISSKLMNQMLDRGFKLIESGEVENLFFLSETIARCFLLINIVLFPEDTIASIDSMLLQNREACPALFIVTSYDNYASLWTKSAPSNEVLRRTRQLASETLISFGKMTLGELSNVKQLFIANQDGYDVIIHLRPLLNPLRHEHITSDELEGQINLPAYNASDSQHIPVVDFNPVQLYLQELRRNYATFANFFYDSYGGNEIGVLWIPIAKEVKEFKVAHVGGRKLVDSNLLLNIQALIEDFYLLGKGLVKSIDQRK